jgi:hypothetical protein
MIVVAPKFLKFVAWCFRFEFEVAGFALLPFVFVMNEDIKNNKIIINHERIHLRQQLELLFFVFAIWYIIAIIRKGYMGISFEKEAYANDTNLDYLNTRPWFAFYKYRK